MTSRRPQTIKNHGFIQAKLLRIHTVDLIVFAHRAEAKSFLDHERCQAVDGLQNLYKSHRLNEAPDFYLFICGEGHYNALNGLSYVLGKLGPQVKRIVNFGVCGALDSALSVGKLYPIRTIYSEALLSDAPSSHQHEVNFKSFTCHQEGLDLITANKRVLSRDYKTYLGHFAPLVDREAWAIAFAAKQANLPLSIYKLVSDKADQKDEQELCQIVKDQALFWSEQMYLFYQQHRTPHEEQDQLELPQALQDNRLHFTLSQKRIVLQFLKTLALKGHQLEDILQTIKLETVLSQDIKPKERTKLLTKELNDLLNPLKARVDGQLRELSSPFSQKNIHLSFDKDLEKDLFHLSCTITSPQQLKDLTDLLDNFNFEKLQEILKGEHV